MPIARTMEAQSVAGLSAKQELVDERKGDMIMGEETVV